ncbi:Hypothetical protein FKW44_024553, partial [Caligus rogercresseyi]
RCNEFNRKEMIIRIKKCICHIKRLGFHRWERIQLWNSHVIPKVAHILRICEFDDKIAASLDEVLMNFLDLKSKKN